MLFELGRFVATPGALEVLEESGHHPLEFSARHANGDWGDLDDEDKGENAFSVRNDSVSSRPITPALVTKSGSSRA